MYELKEGRQMRPKTRKHGHNMMYERRFGPFFVEPVRSGPGLEPYICNMDLMRMYNRASRTLCLEEPEEQLMGMCETLGAQHGT